MKVSASLIKSFMNCPLQAKFRYIDGLEEKQNAAASFGSAVHLALELYNNTGDVSAAVRCFRYVWQNPAEFGIEPEVWPPRTNFGSYMERGEDFIKQYHQNNKWVNREILATEFRFCVPIGNHHISGIVDYLELPKNLDELWVVDLKTGFRPNGNNLALDTQFSSYLWAVHQKDFWCGSDIDRSKYTGFPNGEELYERFKKYTVLGIWYDLRNGKGYQVGARSDSDFNRLKRCIDEIAKAVERDVYVPDISGDTCGICSFRETCEAYPGL